MKTFKRSGSILILTLLMVITMVGVVSAESASPNLPQAFYGSITAADGSRVNGGTIQAKLNGEVFSFTFSGATYGSVEKLSERLLVWGAEPGSIITFTVNGVPATTTAPYTPGEITFLNISIPRGSSSGGGGGGGSVPPTGRRASVSVQASSETRVQDSTGTLQLVIPAGTLPLSTEGEATVTVKELLGSQITDLVKADTIPPGVNSVGIAFEISVESTNEQVITNFNKPITFALQLSEEELEGVEDPEKLGLFRVNADGTLAFAGGKYIDGQLISPIYAPGQYVMAEVDIQFEDMDTHWAQKDVELMAAKYIANGYPDGRFLPEENVTRAEFACMLVRALGLPTTEGTTSFQDVNSTDWYYQDLGVAVNTGIIKGFTDGTFRPGAFVSREEVAAMVARALKSTGKAEELTAEQLQGILASFNDNGQIDAWAKADLALAAQTGIINGVNANTIAPKGKATRAQSAVMIARLWHK